MNIIYVERLGQDGKHSYFEHMTPEQFAAEQAAIPNPQAEARKKARDKLNAIKAKGKAAWTSDDLKDGLEAALLIIGI